MIEDHRNSYRDDVHYKLDLNTYLGTIIPK